MSCHAGDAKIPATTIPSEPLSPDWEVETFFLFAAMTR